MLTALTSAPTCAHRLSPTHNTTPTHHPHHTYSPFVPYKPHTPYAPNPPDTPHAPHSPHPPYTPHTPHTHPTHHNERASRRASVYITQGAIPLKKKLDTITLHQQLRQRHAKKAQILNTCIPLIIHTGIYGNKQYIQTAYTVPPP